MVRNTVVAKSRKVRGSGNARMMEALEARVLMTGVTPYNPLPGQSIQGAAWSGGVLYVGVQGASTDIYKVDTSNGNLTPVITVGTGGIFNLTGAPDGDLWYVDGNTGDIKEVVDPNGLTPTIESYSVPDLATDAPATLTVTGNGSVWWTAISANMNMLNQMERTNRIGRLDPGVGITMFEVNTVASQIRDSEGLSIASAGADSVVIGYRRTGDDSTFEGTNRIGFATYSTGSSSIVLTSLVDANSPSAGGDVGDADATNFLTSVAVQGDGSVWFSLTGMESGTSRTSEADRLVKLDTSSVQTAYVIPGATPGQVLLVDGLAFDGNERLWFKEALGQKVGLYDTFTESFEDPLVSIPGNEQFIGIPVRLDSLAVNPAEGATDAWVTTNTSSDVSLAQVKIDIPEEPPIFGAIAINFSAQEDVVVSHAVGTFVTTPGSYTASITWADLSTSTATVTAVIGSPGMYTVTLDGKTFNTQGSYIGTVHVLDGVTEIGQFDFTVTISDTQLTVTSYTVMPDHGRFAAVSLTFTDDVDSTVSQFTATISWETGVTTSALIMADPTQAGRYIVVGMHRYTGRKRTVSVTTTVTTSEANVLPLLSVVSATSLYNV